MPPIPIVSYTRQYQGKSDISGTSFDEMNVIWLHFDPKTWFSMAMLSLGSKIYVTIWAWPIRARDGTILSHVDTKLK